jgi:transposase
VRDWVVRFNARGPTGLIDGKAPGGRPLLSDDQRRALARVVEDGPIPASHGVVRWRIVDLIQWLFDEYGVSVSKQTLSRDLRAMGYRKLTARPRHHAQEADAIDVFKKTSQPSWQRLKRHSRVARP